MKKIEITSNQMAFVSGLSAMLIFIFGIICILVLSIGYYPRVYTGGEYQQANAVVIGYGQQNQDCVYSCNCRKECRPTKPRCQSWETRTVCDACRSPCVAAWVMYWIESQSFSFNAFPIINSNPIPQLQSKYPINSTMNTYFSSSSSTVVYGNTLNTATSCFVAGFVFLGLTGLVMLIWGSFLILYYCFQNKNL